MNLRIPQHRFPSPAWLDALQQKLNADAHYADVAAKWEGALFFDIRPGGRLEQAVAMHLDLWHGSCRSVTYGTPLAKLPRPRFILSSEYPNFAAVLRGELHPMTAMITNELRVDGSLGYMMRNVPTVLDLVRCAREITQDAL